MKEAKGEKEKVRGEEEKGGVKGEEREEYTRLWKQAMEEK
jgi:hypothetical protein